MRALALLLLGQQGVDQLGLRARLAGAHEPLQASARHPHGHGLAARLRGLPALV